jgi:hypothetical protein
MKRALLLVGLAATACSQAKTECSCADPRAPVRVPPESAAVVTEVRLSGPARSGQKATCTQAARAGCATDAILATTAGTCEVEVILEDRTIRATETFAPGSSCCTGISPMPASVGEIDPARGRSEGGAG